MISSTPTPRSKLQKELRPLNEVYLKHRGVAGHGISGGAGHGSPSAGRTDASGGAVPRSSEDRARRSSPGLTTS